MEIITGFRIENKNGDGPFYTKDGFWIADPGKYPQEQEHEDRSAFYTLASFLHFDYYKEFFESDDYVLYKVLIPKEAILFGVEETIIYNPFKCPVEKIIIDNDIKKTLFTRKTGKDLRKEARERTEAK